MKSGEVMIMTKCDLVVDNIVIGNNLAKALKLRGTKKGKKRL